MSEQREPGGCKRGPGFVLCTPAPGSYSSMVEEREAYYRSIGYHGPPTKKRARRKSTEGGEGGKAE